MAGQPRVWAGCRRGESERWAGEKEEVVKRGGALCAGLPGLVKGALIGPMMAQESATPGVSETGCLRPATGAASEVQDGAACMAAAAQCCVAVFKSRGDDLESLLVKSLCKQQFGVLCSFKNGPEMGQGWCHGGVLSERQSFW